VTLLMVMALVVGSITQPEKPSKPKVDLVVSPQISIARHQGNLVTVQLIVHNPTEEFWCPEVEYDWGEGEAPSTEGGDCTPYEQTSPEERQRWSPDGSKSKTYRGEGVRILTVRFKKNGKTIQGASWSRVIDIR
jgi:hypothetical protein